MHTCRQMTRKTQPYKNLWDAAKAVLRGKFMVIRMAILKKTRQISNKPNLSPTRIRKRTKSKVSTSTEIIKIREEINRGQMQVHGDPTHTYIHTQAITLWPLHTHTHTHTHTISLWILHTYTHRQSLYDHYTHIHTHTHHHFMDTTHIHNHFVATTHTYVYIHAVTLWPLYTHTYTQCTNTITLWPVHTHTHT